MTDIPEDVMKMAEAVNARIVNDECNDIEFIARAIMAERERRWQPIETAPKDGTKVLVGRFAPGKVKDGRVRVDWYRQGEDLAGFVGFGEFNQQHWPPTHWQPIIPPNTTNLD